MWNIRHQKLRYHFNSTGPKDPAGLKCSECWKCSQTYFCTRENYLPAFPSIKTAKKGSSRQNIGKKRKCFLKCLSDSSNFFLHWQVYLKSRYLLEKLISEFKIPAKKEDYATLNILKLNQQICRFCLKVMIL